ncbi:MAG: flagellar hook-basal body protein [Sulfurovum sp. FS06-10]|nr:MAG: flagellar hook-basal body protein [Sulfurovum sp. FS06-10]
MNSSFYNGISGVKTHQFGMDVWANNISNISTYGFRGSTPEFSSLFSATLMGSYFDPTSNDKGLGAQSQTTGLNLQQGILEHTDRAFDLAIQGEGWFAVQGQDNEIFYTRAGAFSIDANGNLVDGNGCYLQATLGNNVTPTTLDQATLDKFGQYYTPTTSRPVEAYAISLLGDVPLGTVGNQNKITLPDYLYFPPEATQNVSYGANLNPTINIGPIQIALNALDCPSTVSASALNTIDISGTIANTPEILNPQTGDVVIITITDSTGAKRSISTALDASQNWSISDYDVSNLDLSSPLQVSAKLQTEQEIANVAHYTTGIIGPDGDKDIIDMTFTKHIPQPTSGSEWDANVKILSFYENYTVQQYDPTQTYDPALYDVNVAYSTVKKIYDPALYYVNTSNNKVYEIVDTQTGVVTFGGAGQLLTNTIPALSNGGTPLTLNLGEPNSYTGLISSTTLEKSNVATSDGYVEGFLSAYGMDGYGNVIAEFSNGRSSAIAKVALYHFQNDQGLTQTTSTYFTPSSNSGNPIFYANANGESFLGSKIVSTKLEGSNVSMATALTELIIMQKAFDASAKSITTSDQLIQNAINMKK